MEINWAKINHFICDEFDDPDLPRSGEFINPDTVSLLDQLREQTGWPIVTHNKFGLHGCVCIDNAGHSKKSHHYIENPEGPSAVDWHFAAPVDARANARDQVMSVLRSGFTGIGIYYNWKWDGRPLSVGFHTDMRNRPQVWTRKNGKYLYLLK